MSYDIEKEFLDMQGDYGFPTSAKALSDNNEKKQKLAQQIAFGKEEKERRFYEGQNKQTEALQNNLKQSELNYQQLKESYDLQKKEFDANKKALKFSRICNIIVCVTAVISLIISFVALIK